VLAAEEAENKKREAARRTRVKEATKAIEARAAADQTTDEDAHQRAVEEAEEAERLGEKAAAKDRARPPRKKAGTAPPPPTPGNAEMMLAGLEVETGCRAIEKAVQKVEKEALPLLSGFSEDFADTSVERLRDTISKVQRLLSRFEAHQSKAKRGGHLSVVSENAVHDLVREIQTLQDDVAERTRVLIRTGIPLEEERALLQDALLRLSRTALTLSNEVVGRESAFPLAETPVRMYAPSAAHDDYGALLNDAASVAIDLPELLDATHSGWRDTDVPPWLLERVTRASEMWVDLAETVANNVNNYDRSTPPAPPVPLLTLEREKPDTTPRQLLASEDMARPDPFAADRAQVNPPGSNLILKTEKPTKPVRDDYPDLPAVIDRRKPRTVKVQVSYETWSISAPFIDGPTMALTTPPDDDLALSWEANGAGCSAEGHDHREYHVDGVLDDVGFIARLDRGYGGDVIELGVTDTPEEAMALCQQHHVATLEPTPTDEPPTKPTKQAVAVTLPWKEGKDPEDRRRTLSVEMTDALGCEHHIIIKILCRGSYAISWATPDGEQSYGTVKTMAEAKDRAELLWGQFVKSVAECQVEEAGETLLSP
jgi:hypothetical protein